MLIRTRASVIAIAIALYSICGLIAFVAHLDVSRIIADLLAILQRAKESLIVAAHEVAALRLHIIVNAQRGGHAQAARGGLYLAQITCTR